MVGAPGGGRPDGTGGSDMTGAVYIYYGRPEGLDSARPQVIYGSDLAATRLSRFGGAISGGESWDMDGNGYDGELAVSLVMMASDSLSSWQPLMSSASKPMN